MLKTDMRGRWNNNSLVFTFIAHNSTSFHSIINSLSFPKSSSNFKKYWNVTCFSRCIIHNASCTSGTPLLYNCYYICVHNMLCQHRPTWTGANHGTDMVGLWPDVKLWSNKLRYPWNNDATNSFKKHWKCLRGNWGK